MSVLSFAEAFKISTEVLFVPDPAAYINVYAETTLEHENV